VFDNATSPFTGILVAPEFAHPFLTLVTPMIDTAALSQEELLLLIELRRQCQRAAAAGLQFYHHIDRAVKTPSLGTEAAISRNPSTTR
jgi:hypothetical protein